MAKYIKMYATSGVAIADETIVSPNVSYIAGNAKLLMMDAGEDEKELEIKESAGELVIQEKSSGPQLVDLGLPSGLLWLDRNIGSTSPEMDGAYIAWGDTTAYMPAQITSTTMFDTAWYQALPAYQISSKLTGNNDIATLTYGDGYRMPTKAEAQELIDNCTLATKIINNMLTMKFTSNNNGNYIYFPISGYYHKGELGGVDWPTYGAYLWMSDYMSKENQDGWYIYSDGEEGGSICMSYINTSTKCQGYSVRAVHAAN